MILKKDSFSIASPEKRNLLEINKLFFCFLILLSNFKIFFNDLLLNEESNNNVLRLFPSLYE